MPAHEAHHPAEDSRQPRLHAGGGRHRSRDRRAGTARGGAHGEPEELKPSQLPAGRREGATMSDNVHDVIIIGGGIAGLFCALKLSPRPVTVLTAAPIGQGASSAWAQGGIAAAVAEGDTPEAHARDTTAAGAGL